ncbi:hypothetical protein FRB90_006901 [Tulasnella sp. 427]|nr:hypothetical protein FRB90_006901 [Tulasnella sp. 427]
MKKLKPRRRRFRHPGGDDDQDPRDEAEAEAEAEEVDMRRSSMPQQTSKPKQIIEDCSRAPNTPRAPRWKTMTKSLSNLACRTRGAIQIGAHPKRSTREVDYAFKTRRPTTHSKSGGNEYYDDDLGRHGESEDGDYYDYDDDYEANDEDHAKNAVDDEDSSDEVHQQNQKGSPGNNEEAQAETHYDLAELDLPNENNPSIRFSPDGLIAKPAGEPGRATREKKKGYCLRRAMGYLLSSLRSIRAVKQNLEREE